MNTKLLQAGIFATLIALVSVTSCKKNDSSSGTTGSTASTSGTSSTSTTATTQSTATTATTSTTSSTATTATTSTTSSTGSTSTTSAGTNSMIIDGTPYTLAFVNGISNASGAQYYSVTGGGTVPENFSIAVNLYGIPMPSDGSVFTVDQMGGAGTTNPMMGLKGEAYSARTGSVTVNIVNGKVKVSFSNMVFKGMLDSTKTVTVSYTATAP